MFQVIRLRKAAVPAAAVLMLLAGLCVRSPQFPLTSAAMARNEERIAYLTFDDGPSTNTTALLDVLSRNDISATFFVTGQYTGNTAALLQNIAEAGHTIGLHSWQHEYGEIYSGSEAFWADLAKIDDLAYEAVGLHSRFYRFPGGSKNRFCPEWLRQELKGQLADKGYTYFDWNVVSGDQGREVLSAQELFENVMEGVGQAEPGPVMILFHDTGHCRTTPEAAELVICAMKQEGWQFLPITEETVPIQF